MGRPVEPCWFCGAKRPRALRRRTRLDSGQVRRIAACFDCKGVPGLDVPDRFRDAIRVRLEAVHAGADRSTAAPEAVLQLGDCRNLLDTVAGVRLFFTDVPYNIDFDYGGVPDNLPWAEYLALMDVVARKSYLATMGGGSFVLVHYPEYAARLMPVFEAAGWRFHQWTTWVYEDRRGAGGSRFCRSSRACVWFSKGEQPFFQAPPGRRALDWFQCDQVRGGSIGWQGYGCQIPAALLRRFISALSQPGDLVADPFLGTGSTAKEAVFLGRRAWGCDVNPEAVPLWAPLGQAGNVSVDGPLPVPAGPGIGPQLEARTGQQVLVLVDEATSPGGAA